MFKVTTLDLDNLPKNEDGETDYDQDFFGKPSNLAPLVDSWRLSLVQWL